VVDAPMSKIVPMTPDDVETGLADLPRIVRLALTFGSRLRRGTLDVSALH
jgi:cyclopropane-fatty-acyl-phospholipid synthase